jgi:hypothetical protein
VFHLSDQNLIKKTKTILRRCYDDVGILGREDRSKALFLWEIEFFVVVRDCFVCFSSASGRNIDGASIQTSRIGTDY